MRDLKWRWGGVMEGAALWGESFLWEHSVGLLSS